MQVINLYGNITKIYIPIKQHNNKNIHNEKNNILTNNNSINTNNNN